jgi:outer membrane lipoprotein-sorting protein
MAGLALALLASLALPSHSADLDATTIVRKADEVLNQETVFARMKMTIVTTSGATRDLYFDSWMKDRGEKSLIRYTDPPRVKGQAMLMLNNADDIWSYFPRTGRVRKLATHAKRQKMQGSDFSYEDMGSGNSFVTDFDHRLLGEESMDGHECYKIELKRKEGTDSNYSRIVAWIGKEQFVIWRMDYYEEGDPDHPSKRLTTSDLKTVDGVPTPMKMVMRNLLDGTETTQEILEVSYNMKIDDGMFTERGLEK